MRLDELIKYIFDNDIKGEGDYGLINYHSDADTDVEVNRCGQVSVHGFYSGEELFEIETEGEITEDTEFDCVISVDIDGYTFKTFNTTIDHMNSIYSDLVQILAYINGKFITIWERDKHVSN